MGGKSNNHAQHQNLRHPTNRLIAWTTWWLWRGAYTRSHPELGRENPQRPWYCVLRHGRVGRRQVLQTIKSQVRANFDNHTIIKHKTKRRGPLDSKTNLMSDTPARST